MYSFTLQNAQEGLRPGILTQFYSNEFNDPDEDAKFNDTIKNAEKQIHKINQHLNKNKHINTDIEKYKNNLLQIRTDIDAFLDKDQEIFVLLDKMIEINQK